MDNAPRAFGLSEAGPCQGLRKRNPYAGRNLWSGEQAGRISLPNDKLSRGRGWLVTEKKAPVPRRTREHVIASQSRNYVEKFFIDRGHTLDRPSEDYGTDLLANTFGSDGYQENGYIRIQLKASDKMSFASDGSYISFSVEIKHYHSWTQEPMPVFLILYDAQAATAYWLYFQEYFSSGKGKKPGKKAKSVTIRIPTKNRLTAETVDYMRERKAAILKQMEGQVHHDA
jgi:hypothetical protein